MTPPIQTTAGLEAPFDLTSYFPIFVYLGFVLAFAVGTLAASHIPFLKPRKPTTVKVMPYESGMDPVGSARMQFDVKFYLIAILFLVFDVELLFLYPWAVTAYVEGVDPHWREVFGRLVFGSVLVFILMIVVAFAYDWRKGVFKWR